MATYNKFNQFVTDLAIKVHNLHHTGGDTLKVMLVETPAPVATNSIKANLTEISAGNGYTAGGTQAVVNAGSGQSPAGTHKLILNDVVFTATGAMAQFRYAVLYNDTPTSPADPLIAWWDYGSLVNLSTGETFTVDFDAANGVLTIT